MQLTLEIIKQHFSKLEEDVSMPTHYDFDNYNLQTFLHMLKISKIEITNYMIEHYIMEPKIEEYLQNNILNDKIIDFICKIFNISILMFNIKCKFYKLFINSKYLNINSKFYCFTYGDNKLAYSPMNNTLEFIKNNMNNIFLINTNENIEFSGYDHDLISI